ncbi:hypothetical protein [Caproiciproducens galactitolivorans]|uniref:Uncharacterized protein n=1 Tax=Caproiciproducens galactitolivorans TaxID=642589 RepID=A0ABT4BP66_9FIRM|nr:hypothetical protein [Caproiciproducens galactitolivorans]MCY1712674.1 hypothetical protein [Caproiciproducens galactitolivorans]
MKTKFVSLLLCLVMCFSLVPNTAFAAKRATTPRPKATSSATVKKAAKPAKKGSKKATVKKSAKKVAKNTSTAKKVQTVYWVDDTKIYHSSKNCRTLKKSKAIHSGTLAQAQKAGHTQLCKVCH